MTFAALKQRRSGDAPAYHLCVSAAKAVALALTIAVAAAFPSHAQTATEQHSLETTMELHPYVGMWVTADGHIRQELLPNNRYDEARGTRTSAYQGRYEVTGNEIFYWDDTGFTADGVFVSDDELRHGGMIFFREK